MIDKVIDAIKKPSIPEILSSPFQTRMVNSRRAIKSLRRKLDLKKTLPEQIADSMTTIFGSFVFLLINAIFFVSWVLINLGRLPVVGIFDPFPFVMLTTVVSLEAIILSIFVLISQNREQKINDLRDEVDLEVDVVTESEVTKILEIVTKIAKKQGIDLSDDNELKEMLKPLDKGKIELTLGREILQNHNNVSVK